jgi:hypothetical protein
MKILKNFISLAIVLVAILSMGSSSMARLYGDVSQDRAERQAIEYLSQKSIFRGQGDGKRFDPDGILNRAEWAVLLTRERGVIPTLEEYGFCFPDVANEWFAAAVCYAKEQAWVKGFNAGVEAGLYVPTNALTVADILVMLARMQEWPTVAGETWYSGAYEYALQSKILSEALFPWHQVTRAQAAEILFRSLVIREYSVAQYDPIIADLLTTKKEENSEDNESNEGIPIVQLRPFLDQEEDNAIARGATNVPVFRFELEAKEDVILEELAITRISAGLTQDIDHSRLIINGEVLTKGSFSRGTEKFIWSNLQIPMKKDGLILVELSVDFVPEAQAQLLYQFQVDAQSLGFNKAVKIQGETIQGETFRTIDLLADSITIANETKVLRLPYLGEEREIIGRFKITAGDHDVLIKRIRLKDSANVNVVNFSNFRLTAGSTEVGFIESIERNQLDFIINDYFLEKDQSRVFTVRADISEFARKTDTIRLYMEDSRDLYAFDFDFKFGVQIINEFDIQKAWCVGSDSPECPPEGLRKRCSKDDIEFENRDCEIEDDSVDLLNQECDERTAPVCGITQEATEDTEAIKETFQNRCLAEIAGSTGILPGPCL